MNDSTSQAPGDTTEPASLTAQLRTMLEKHLVEIFTNGRKVVTKAGEVVTIAPSAADVCQLRQWIQFLANPAHGDTGEVDEVTQGLIKAAEKQGIHFQGRPIPPLDMMNDDAATA